jgi:hypothetical protein
MVSRRIRLEVARRAMAHRRVVRRMACLRRENKCK